MLINVDYKEKYEQSQQTIKDRYGDFEVPYYGKDNNDYVNGGGFCCDDSPSLRAGTIGNGNDNPEIYQYYYHSDHLGSTSLITDLDGEALQHVEYVPFGEVFIEERNNKWNTPYLFNAKELDEETGLYYYGARYLDSRSSVWLSVDPLWEKYPGISAYTYCLNNPVNAIDTDGRSTYVIANEDGTYQVIDGNREDGDLNIYSINYNKDGKYAGMNSIGKSTSMTSFYNDSKDENGKELGWMGTIDPKDNSSKQFLDNFVKSDLEIGYYCCCVNF